MNQTDRPRLKYEVLLFFAATIFITWLVWLPAFLIQNHGISMRLSYNFFITIGTFVPSMTGFLFTCLFGGKTDVLALCKSLLNVHISLKWLLFTFLVLPMVSAVTCLICYLTVGTLPQMQFPPWFIPIAFVYILIFMGPLGEEAGWRGFALKKMLGYLSPLKAAVLLGLIWSLWHLPLFFINGTTQHTLTSFGIIPAILGYFLYTVMISIFITLLYLKSNGSVFGSILLHTVGNLSLGVVPFIFSKNGAIILLLTLGITATAIIYKYKKVLFEEVEV